MDDKLVLTGRPADDDDDPRVIDDLRRLVQRLIPENVDAAGGWVPAKVDTERAKASEIRAKVLSQLADVELERDRVHLEFQKEHNRQQAEMFRAQTERIRAISDALQTLHNMGVTVNAEVVETIVRNGVFQLPEVKPLPPNAVDTNQ